MPSSNHFLFIPHKNCCIKFKSSKTQKIQIFGAEICLFWSQYNKNIKRFLHQNVCLIKTVILVYNTFVYGEQFLRYLYVYISNDGLQSLDSTGIVQIVSRNIQQYIVSFISIFRNFPTFQFSTFAQLMSIFPQCALDGSLCSHAI